jgi:glycosyltransferase involved in cell wall biosynthesis
MNVLNVNMTLDLVAGGGTVERTLQMTRFLVKRGVGCIVLSTDLGWTEARAKSFTGIEVIALPCLWKRFYVPMIWFRSICDAVARADVIHLMGHWTLINACAYLFARYFQKPYVVCPAGALLIYGRSKLLKRLYNFVIGKRIIRNASGYIAISTNEITHFESYGIAPEQITIIPNGIDEDGFAVTDDVAFRSKYGLNESPFILFVGRLNPIKGPDLLLEAFSRVSEEFCRYHLVFAGPDEGMLHELRLMAARFSIQDRVHFVGYLDGDDKVRAYRAAELVVVPSRQEAMSIVILEAGAAGKPVLLTDQCGFEEVAKVNGGCVVPASVPGLKRGLQSMLADLERLKAMGKNLQQFVFERFAWATLVDAYLSLYREILKDRGR